MQAFLHFSSRQATPEIFDFMKETCQRFAGEDYQILSRSDMLGGASICRLATPPALAPLRVEAASYGIDVNLLSEAPFVRKLMLCDMDSTIITGESLDELSAMAGIGDEVAAITARAMAGELDFRQALTERLAMLAGQPATMLETLIAQTDCFAGAAELVATMRQNDAHCLLVSGGFTFLTSDIAERLGFHEHHANELAIANGKITGKVTEPLVDSSTKLTILQRYCASLGLSSSQVMSMGDGANDIPMLEAAGLGIAWQAKPLVKERIAVQLSHSSLCGPLFLQGISEADITDKL